MVLGRSEMIGLVISIIILMTVGIKGGLVYWGCWKCMDCRSLGLFDEV